MMSSTINGISTNTSNVFINLVQNIKFSISSININKGYQEGGDIIILNVPGIDSTKIATTEVRLWGIPCPVQSIINT